MSNVEQGILTIEHGIDIRSAFAKAMAGQVLDIPAFFKGVSWAHPFYGRRTQ